MSDKAFSTCPLVPWYMYMPRKYTTMRLTTAYTYYQTCNYHQNDTCTCIWQCVILIVLGNLHQISYDNYFEVFRFHSCVFDIRSIKVKQAGTDSEYFEIVNLTCLMPPFRLHFFPCVLEVLNYKTTWNSRLNEYVKYDLPTYSIPNQHG